MIRETNIFSEQGKGLFFFSLKKTHTKQIRIMFLISAKYSYKRFTNVKLCNYHNSEVGTLIRVGTIIISFYKWSHWGTVGLACWSSKVWTWSQAFWLYIFFNYLLLNAAFCFLKALLIRLCVTCSLLNIFDFWKDVFYAVHYKNVHRLLHMMPWCLFLI